MQTSDAGIDVISEQSSTPNAMVYLGPLLLARSTSHVVNMLAAHVCGLQMMHVAWIIPTPML